MKTIYHFIIVFIAMLIIAGVVIASHPTPLKEPPLSPKQQALAWLETDKQIHLSYLTKPEEPIYAEPYINTGTHTFHREWANNLDEIIKFINQQPSKFTKQDCLDILGEAQATHAGSTSCNYDIIKWNYEWFERYNKIILYINSMY